MKIKKTSLVGMILALALVIGTGTVFATNAASASDGRNVPPVPRTEAAQLISIKLSDESIFDPDEWQDILKQIERGEIAVEPENKPRGFTSDTVSSTVDEDTPPPVPNKTEAAKER